FQRARSSKYLLGDIRGAEIRAIRVEVALIVAILILLFWLLRLRWPSVLIMYACFSFNWSTRQYIGHAFSPRDVIEGAWNLRHNRVMTWVLLHGEWDLNHHRHPEVPWYYLPRLSPPDEPRISHLWQCVRQWLGPRPDAEPGPESVRALPLSVHQRRRNATRPWRGRPGTASATRCGWPRPWRSGGWLCTPGLTTGTASGRVGY